MLGDLAVLGAGVRVLLGAVRRGRERRTGTGGDAGLSCLTRRAWHFRPDLASTTFTSYWVYIAGPIAGAVIAVGIAFVLRAPRRRQVRRRGRPG